MELPLTIMDSAVLSPGRMALTQRSAAAACLEIVERTRRFGGTVVVNWHCRAWRPSGDGGLPIPNSSLSSGETAAPGSRLLQTR